MSISTGSIRSYCSDGSSCSSFSFSSGMSGHPTPRAVKSCTEPNTRKEAKQKDQLPGWCSEINNKIHRFGDTIDEFLDVVVPSPTPCTLSDPEVSISEKFVPVKGNDKKSYEPLIEIFTKLVSDFPKDKKLSFYNAHDQPLPFPFPEFTRRHHVAKPDIAVSFPGETLQAHVAHPDWSQFSMVIEAKDMMNRDPFDRLSSISFEKSNTIIQLSVSARSLMAAHGLLATFAFGVYGDVVRIARFDHACGVASPALSLKTAEGLKGIRDFFWRFVHPWTPGPRAVVGCDSTIRKLDDGDVAWLQQRLGSEASDLLHGIDLLRHARRVEVWDDAEGASRAFIAFKLIETNARLFSRSTMVWLGIEDTRIEGSPDRDDGEDPQLCVLKEAWRQLLRTPEKVFYDRLEETVPEDEWVGIPHMVCGGDLGQLEAKHYEAACGSPRRQARWPAGFDSATSVASRDGSSDDLPRPLHQTYSWRLAQGTVSKPKERSHMRFVVDVVGRPLSRFSSSKQVALAMRDALKGHRLAMEYGGILHRDISSGNILIVDRPGSDRKSKGVIHDFDYSSVLRRAPRSAPSRRTRKTCPEDLRPLELSDEYKNIMELKERTGTYYFIAMELLDPSCPTVNHDAHHDLESYYWVLLWIVLRHTRHNHPKGREACAKVFPYSDDTDAVYAKSGFLSRTRPTFQVDNNEPLTQLLLRFGSLVKESEDKHVRLTYDAVLSIFDDVLAMPNWPENDRSIPFLPKTLPLVTVHEGVLPSPHGKVSKRRATASATDVISGFPSRSGALASGASGRSKKQKTSHASLLSGLSRGNGGAAASSSTRVASHTSRKARTSNATSRQTKVASRGSVTKAKPSGSRSR
ncbi:hypothetical protein BD413DRAFT_74849 [Trametes elegans]|nr:hypothetical protein BD413DRAFT_74849 [Trametes elegans]